MPRRRVSLLHSISSSRRWSRLSTRQCTFLPSPSRFALTNLVTLYSPLLREAEKLYKLLAPAGDIHRGRDIEKLKALTLQAETLMRTLPSTATQGCEPDMDIALKGIVTEKKMPAKLPKPSLNTVDDWMDGEDVEVREELEG